MNSFLLTSFYVLCLCKRGDLNFCTNSNLPYKTETDNNCANFNQICVKTDDKQCKNFMDICAQCPPSHYTSIMLRDLLNQTHGVKTDIEAGCSQTRLIAISVFILIFSIICIILQIAKKFFKKKCCTTRKGKDSKGKGEGTALMDQNDGSANNDLRQKMEEISNQLSHVSTVTSSLENGNKFDDLRKEFVKTLDSKIESKIDKLPELISNKFDDLRKEFVKTLDDKIKVNLSEVNIKLESMSKDLEKISDANWNVVKEINNKLNSLSAKNKSQFNREELLDFYEKLNSKTKKNVQTALIESNMLSKLDDILKYLRINKI